MRMQIKRICWHVSNLWHFCVFFPAQISIEKHAVSRLAKPGKSIDDITGISFNLKTNIWWVPIQKSILPSAIIIQINKAMHLSSASSVSNVLNIYHYSFHSMNIVVLYLFRSEVYRDHQTHTHFFRSSYRRHRPHHVHLHYTTTHDVKKHTVHLVFVKAFIDADSTNASFSYSLKSIFGSPCF